MYSTELMEQILTSEIGQQIIQRVTNKYGNSYVGLWLFQIIGMSNDEVKAMVEDFKNQTLPQTATWSLSLWEQSMGLPVNESESVEQRRQNIIEKRRRRNAMNPARIEEIISAMTGADVRMDEYYDKNRFAIYIPSIPIDESAIRKKLKSIKQSHKVFDIIFEIQGNIYESGIVTYMSEDIELSVDTSFNNNEEYIFTNIGIVVSDIEQGRAYPAQKYNTYADVNTLTHEQIKEKTFAQLLYKEDN